MRLRSTPPCHEAHHPVPYPYAPLTHPQPMDDALKQRIRDLINSSTLFLFIKGTKVMPQCGFSNNVVQIMNALGVQYETFDVLSDPDIRQGIKAYGNWPTIPQVYLKGEFLGGSDIMIEMYNSGELREMLAVAMAS